MIVLRVCSCNMQVIRLTQYKNGETRLGKKSEIGSRSTIDREGLCDIRLIRNEEQQKTESVILVFSRSSQDFWSQKVSLNPIVSLASCIEPIIN